MKMSEIQKAMKGKFKIEPLHKVMLGMEVSTGAWKITCLKCKRKFQLPMAKDYRPGTLLTLLNHYMSHEPVRDEA